MKNQHLNNGKKLNKKELKTIKGGVMICAGGANGGCAQIHPSCYEKQCRPGVTEVCMPTSNTCIKRSFNCVEPPCWPNLEPPIL
ncbi:MULTISPECIES: bacteriocin [Chryseobacterium]|uniref:Bacteriocin n=1 Tax=Chryseobacterium candidae TaxID=1978493 RepID=A0ABY2R2T1_9FLAO|nr:MULTISPECIES: bacteriocin [Chryseobacterium]PXW18275.1 bacteriocin-like protein [Chryseobacterium sp. CBTAP 102]THV56402.1 bacteriocin [Chryseobacterium candidae]